MSTASLLVVGGGPAGMSAAIAAAEHGVPVTVVDEGLDLGGQIYRKPTRTDGAAPPSAAGESLRGRVAALSERISVRSGAPAWGMFDGLRVAVAHEGRTELLSPGAVVLAPGAHELVPPFPGWTLPGVMTPGAGQILVKSMGVAPGDRVIVAGTGPFLLAVACQLVESGVRVSAVLEATPRLPWLTLPLHGFRTPGVLRDGFKYWLTLARAGVPIRYGRVVVAAEGEGRLALVAHAPVDRDWRPDRGRVVREPADALLIGYGFVPRAQLAQMAGCRLEYRPDVGGWVPARDANFETTVPGIFVAGDGAGVAGVLVAAAEGRLAGLAAAARLGALDPATLATLRSPIVRRLRRLAPVRRELDRITALRPGLASLVEEDTIVCRCEEVRWGEVRESVRSGCCTYRSLKVATRVGMGACQGRYCWPSIARLVGGELRCPPQEVGPSSARPPVRPVTLGELADAKAGKS